MAAKLIVEKLKRTIETQNLIIDDLVRENYELKKILHSDDTHQNANINLCQTMQMSINC